VTKQDSYPITASLSQFGYPIKTPKTDPNELLKSLARSDDLNLLEGFPVVLAHALNQDPSKITLDRSEASLEGTTTLERFQRLVGLSMALFDLYSLLPGGKRLKASLATSEAAEIALKHLPYPGQVLFVERFVEPKFMPQPRDIIGVAVVLNHQDRHITWNHPDQGKDDDRHDEESRND